ncbi:MAG: DUF6585 family protein [Polyangiaceae bacterium]
MTNTPCLSTTAPASPSITRWTTSKSFGTTLNNVLTEIALPRTATPSAAATLDFGTVRPDGHGVHIHDKSLAWPEVQSISWKEGLLSSSEAYLMIRRHGGLLAWTKLPIEEVKNYPVLMAIAADMGKAQ